MKAWQNSQCKNQWYHRFQIISETPLGVLEMCQICKKKKFFKIIQGRLNNMEYLAYHNREALTPNHNKFKREYGLQD